MAKKKNDLLNKKYTYKPTILSVEEIIQRLKPIIQYQTKVCCLEYIAMHGQIRHIDTILTALHKRPLTKNDYATYNIPQQASTPIPANKKTNWIANKLDADYEINDIRATDLFKYMTLLHCPQEGSCMSLLKKYNKDGKEYAKRWSLSTGEIEQLQRFEGEGEFYCSVNSFFCPGRHSSEYIKRLNALFVDLDYYNIPELKNLSGTEVFDKIKKEIDFPKESFVISSGAGLYIIWLLETTYSTPASQKYWSKIEQMLINKFSPYGADARVKDPARVLRLLGTKNSKNNATVQIISNKDVLENPLRYELRDFSDFFNAENSTSTKVTHKLVKKKPKQIFRLKNLLTLNYARTRDIEKLIELRSKQSQEGHREHLLFLYRLHLLYANVTEEQSLEMTLDLNNGLYDPLDDNEIINKTACVVKYADNYKSSLVKYTRAEGSLNDYLSSHNCYIYKNITLVNLLNISEAEQLHMSTLIGLDEKKRRKNMRNRDYFSNPQNVDKYNKGRRKRYLEQLKKEGKLTREEKGILIRRKISKLLESGLSQRAIAKELNVSQSTVNKHIKIMVVEEESLIS